MATTAVQTTTQQSAYSGISFPPRAGIGGGFFAMSTDLDLINNSIYVLLNTKKGSMPMMPTFGSSAQDLLFEPINSTTQGLIVQAIQDDISLWEPRVTVLKIMAASAENNRIFQIQMQLLATGQLITSTISLSAI